VLGGAFAVRVSKRKRADPPEPPVPARSALPGSPLPGSLRSGSADRSLVRMAVGAAVVVVLALVIVVVTRPSDDAGTATPHWVVTPSPGPSGMYLDVTVPGPVGRDDRLVLTGDGGTRAEVDIKQVSDPQTEYPLFNAFPGHRNVMFTIHIHNTGEGWVGTQLDVDSWVLDANGANYQPNQQLSLVGGPDGSTDPQLNPAWQLYPDWQVDRHVGFTVPQDAELTRLHIALQMGDSAPTAEWNL
jgi:hypothetical protein